MTRRAGYVPVKLSRGNAREFAEWLATFRLQEPTILGRVGIPAGKLEANAARDLSLLGDLARSLTVARKGRPRLPVSYYHLPVAALRLINNGWAGAQMPRKLRPKFKRALLSISRKRGPKLSRFDRERNLRSGGYAPETERKYRRLLKRADPPKAKSRLDDVTHLVALPQFHRGQ